VAYLLMNLGAFTVAGLVERHSGSDRLDQFAGLGTRNPRLAAAMTIFLFSLVGLPPLAGFAVKWIILSALWQHQLAFVAVAILANTLLSLFYYMRIARAMYFSSAEGAAVPVPATAGALPPAPATGQPTGPGAAWQPTALADGGEAMPVEVPAPAAIVLAVCAAGLLALFLGWGLLHTFSLSLLSFAP